MDKKYSDYTIRELLFAYANTTLGMHDYELEGLTFKKHYKNLCEKEKEILAEAERRDDKPEGLDEG
jgi:hypothetical protein